MMEVEEFTTEDQKELDRLWQKKTRYELQKMERDLAEYKKALKKYITDEVEKDRGVISTIPRDYYQMWPKHDWFKVVP